MGTLAKTIGLILLKQGVPLVFQMGNNLIQSSIQLQQEKMNQEAIEEHIRIISNIDKQILKQDRIKIPGLDVNKEELGRQTWKKIRENIMELPKDANPEMVKEVMAKNFEMIKQYPCIDCQEDGIKFANEINFTSADTIHEAMIKTWELQNMVNQKIGKPIFPYESFRDQYEL